MVKVNEFENGVGLSDNNNLFPFSVESNIHYRVNSLDDLINNSYETLTHIINHFITNQIPRLEVLDGYSKGRNAGIFSGDRRLDKNKADHRIAHNFGKLIAQFVAGYTTSVPLKYDLPDDSKLNAKLLEFNKENDIATLDNELMYDVAKFGRAYDIQYKNDKGNKIKQANVFETFVIYDTTIERKPVAAVRIVEVGFSKDSVKTYQTILYTDANIVHFKTSTLTNAALQEDHTDSHFYNGVPIVEYQSNKYRTSWYEDVLPLIDAYDQVESDTSNYMTDVINSLLVINGDFSAANTNVNELIKQIQRYGILGLQSGIDRNGNATSIDAKYISPEFDSAASESYKERIRKDIFNISNIPDMTDQNFAGNTTGVAMRYKIFGFEQAIGQTINAFKRSVGDRYELLFNLESNLSVSKKVHSNVLVDYTPNLPYAVSEEVTMLINAGVPISRKTMYHLTHFTTAETEESNLKAEQEQLESSDKLSESFKQANKVNTPDTKEDSSNNAKNDENGDVDG